MAGGGEGEAAAYTLEQKLLRQLRLGHSLFQSLLTLSGPGNLGDCLKLEDGRVVKRLPPRMRPELIDTEALRVAASR